MSEQIPWYHQGATSQTNPFASTGTDWCPRCKMECEVDMASIHQGTTFTYKKWCVRCGRVICNGIYDQVRLMSNVPLPAAALEWNWKPGRDRR